MKKYCIKDSTFEMLTSHKTVHLMYSVQCTVVHSLAGPIWLKTMVSHSKSVLTSPGDCSFFERIKIIPKYQRIKYKVPVV